MTTEQFFDAIPRTGLHPDDMEAARRAVDKLSDEDRAALAAMINGVARCAREDYADDRDWRDD